MFSIFRKKAAPETTRPIQDSPPAVAHTDGEPDRRAWIERLRNGLRRTGAGIADVFSGTRIDDQLYDELEAELLMADAGPAATQQLLSDLKQRVRATKTTDPKSVKGLLEQVLTELLQSLERPLEIGRSSCTVMMVVGVNGAGKTTSIGKLALHLAAARLKVLLAAADTFRAAAREQLAAWAQRVDARNAAAAISEQDSRGEVQIISQQGGDPAAVAYDAVVAGRARHCDVVIADTAGRLPTQMHLMEELKKIKRVIGKTDSEAPHEVILVVDGNTGQNALTQVRAFDEALCLTGLIVTKLDGTAKGGVLAAIALWAHQRASADPGRRPLAVYFLGVGETLEDLQTFRAQEFARALLR
jgi:fused signal recognition particle receptor